MPEEGDTRRCVTPSSQAQGSGTTDVNLRNLGELTLFFIWAPIPDSLRGLEQPPPTQPLPQVWGRDERAALPALIGVYQEMR